MQCKKCFDEMELLLNIQKTTLLYNYTFKEKEKDILNLHRINCFFTDNNQHSKEVNSSEDSLSSSQIFERLKIPKNLLPSRK